MKIKEQFKIRKIGAEYVMVYNENSQMDFSRVIGLNDSAAFLIESVADIDFTIETWTQLLVGRYKIDQQRAQSDAEILADKLKQANIIE